MTADLAALLPSWQLHLRAERKSGETIKSYTAGVTSYLAWSESGSDNRISDLTPAAVNAWVASLLDAGAEPATARIRQLAVRRYSAWLAAEGEIPADELAGLRPPKLDVKITQAVDDAGLARLLKACEGKDIADRRDAAIVRLMIETGARAGEVLAMTTSDVDLARGVAVVRRGKGGTGRVIPFGPRTAAAIDRYLRLRRSHRLAGSSALWLGHGGKGIGYYGLRNSLGSRAEAAGIPGFHIHILRHTAATRWLRAGGSEGGLMSVCGWKRRDMLDRYTAATAAGRAADESRALRLGEL
jgi:integrase/recombinase XerD